MKKIINQFINNPFDGKPIQVAYETRKGPDGKVLKDDFGNPEMIRTDLTTALAIRTFISNGFDPKDTLLTDSHSALRVLDVLRPFKLLESALGHEPPKNIALEDAEYDWLVKNVKERGAKLYGILAELYVKAFEDIEKISEPAKLENLDDFGNGASKPKFVKNRV